MKKIIIAFVAGLALVGAFAWADTTFSWSGAAQSGVLTYTGLGLNGPVMSGKVSNSVTDITVVDGMVISNINPIMHISSAGATCTIANVTTSGQTFFIVNDKTGSTGVVAVASSGNFVGPALSLAAGDMATLVAVGTNWYAVGQ